MELGTAVLLLPAVLSVVGKAEDVRDREVLDLKTEVLREPVTVALAPRLVLALMLGVTEGLPAGAREREPDG